MNDGFDLTLYEPTNVKIYNRYGTEVYQHGKGYTTQWVGQDKNGREFQQVLIIIFLRHLMRQYQDIFI